MLLDNHTYNLGRPVSDMHMKMVITNTPFRILIPLYIADLKKFPCNTFVYLRWELKNNTLYSKLYERSASKLNEYLPDVKIYPKAGVFRSESEMH